MTPKPPSQFSVCLKNRYVNLVWTKHSLHNVIWVNLSLDEYDLCLKDSWTNVIWGRL